MLARKTTGPLDLFSDQRAQLAAACSAALGQQEPSLHQSLPLRINDDNNYWASGSDTSTEHCKGSLIIILIRALLYIIQAKKQVLILLIYNYII